MASELVPSELYHTCLKVDEHGFETNSMLPKFYVLGTHATIEAAKKYALTVLPSLGYAKDDFPDYEERPSVTEWKRGEGVVVYAKAAPGQEFFVSTDTKPNPEKLRAKPDGSLVLPNGVDHLHYLVQMTIDYNNDGKTTTEVQGAYVRRADALKSAKGLLLVEGETKESDYAEFDARDDLDQPKDWPYGEDVLVHAVAPTGENYLIMLKTPPQANRHRKK